MVVTNEMIEGLMAALEGECEGLAIDADQALAILSHVLSGDPALAVAPGVEVKPLKWTDPGSVATYPIWEARGLRYYYSIRTDGPSRHGKYCATVNGDYLRDGGFEDLEAAKAAAQADYTARIMSALATTETNGHE